MTDDNHQPELLLDWDALLIEEARNGDRDSAVSLLREVAGTDPRAGIKTLVLGYLSECISNWMKWDFDPERAAEAFNVQRVASRPADNVAIRQKHIRALRTYYLMRGRRKGFEQAKDIAARASNLSRSSIDKLLAPSEGGLSVEQAAALLGIPKRLRSRCLNPPRKRYQRSR